MTEIESARSPRLDRVLNLIERIGNKLPDPFILFGLLFLLVAVVSTAISAFGVSVTIPGSDEATPIRGAFTGDGLEFLFTTMAENFIGFPPLETVVTIMLAVGLAERTGMLTALIRSSFGNARRSVLPYAVGLVGVSASVMADTSMIIVPPLAALVFKAAGRHPVAGLLGGFAATGAGYSTSIVVTSLDALFSGISNKVAETLPNPGTLVTPVSNYYFNAVSAVLLGLLAGFLIDRLIEPRLIRNGVPAEVADGEESDLKVALEPAERRGLLWAGTSFLVATALVLLLVFWPGSPLANEDGGFLPDSPLMDSVTTLIFLGFAVPAIAYGAKAGSITRAADVPRLMALALRDLTGFLVLAFMLGQFIALFNWSNVGPALAKVGADGLQATGLTGFPVIIGFIILCSILNLFIISGSSMYTIMGAVFVPMFALIGFEPGFTQAAFRIGDSATQVITPMNPYMFVVLMMIRKYEPAAGLGTLISRTLPFVVPFWVAWLLVLTVFYFGGLDVGPGVSPRMD